MAKTKKSLKEQILPFLVGVFAADFFVISIVAGVADVVWFSAANAKRAGAIAIFPVLVLLLVNIIPASWRDCLGHMRWLNPLPGSRAFSVYGPADSRINMVALEQTYGALPTIAKEQNAFWYKLYKKVENETSVIESQRRYLLFRDLTVMSLTLLLVSPVLAIFLDWRQVGWCALILAFQALLCAVSSRNSGIRFITNVLVLHSVKS